MKKQTEPLTDRQKGNKRVILSRRELVRVHRKDTFFSIAVFTLTTIGCFFFNQMASDPTLNIAMLYTCLLYTSPYDLLAWERYDFRQCARGGGEEHSLDRHH